ncbi:MAG: hypothetical protein U5K37_03825 [Natrialbaceae archaeon]|nr:hypothetical protein [Natrialbaceae archaeon]
MRPETELSAGDVESFDTWRALTLATDTKRAKILANVVGHPNGAPSVEELAYMIPTLSADAIRRHLGRLQSVGVIQVRTSRRVPDSGSIPTNSTR